MRYGGKKRGILVEGGEKGAGQPHLLPRLQVRPRLQVPGVQQVAPRSDYVQQHVLHIRTLRKPPGTVLNGTKKVFFNTVVADPDPQDPHSFSCPGSRSVLGQCGSGSRSTEIDKNLQIKTWFPAFQKSFCIFVGMFLIFYLL
jgi:hypothetical protein